jgi:hypothetical protein
LCVVIAGNDGTRRIGFLDEVVAVVGINARSCRGGLVNAAAEGVVLEANS